jgi:hypothetical protein
MKKFIERIMKVSNVHKLESGVYGADTALELLPRICIEVTKTPFFVLLHINETGVTHTFSRGVYDLIEGLTKRQLEQIKDLQATHLENSGEKVTFLEAYGMWANNKNAQV